MTNDKQKLLQQLARQKNQEHAHERQPSREVERERSHTPGSLIDPGDWISQLYGGPPLDHHQRATEKGQKRSDGSHHTPLDVHKLHQKHDAADLAAARKHFNWWKAEIEKAIAENKKKLQEKKRIEQEEEERKRQELQHQKEQESQQDASAGQGKAPARLGQPRRKAQTEQHPETKMGGTK